MTNDDKKVSKPKNNSNPFGTPSSFPAPVKLPEPLRVINEISTGLTKKLYSPDAQNIISSLNKSLSKIHNVLHATNIWLDKERKPLLAGIIAFIQVHEKAKRRAREILDMFDDDNLSLSELYKLDPIDGITLMYILDEAEIKHTKSAQSVHARMINEIKLSKPGGTYEKVATIREIWASGKYSSRDLCAEQEYDALNWNYASARKALRNTPNPEPWPAKKTTR